MKRGLEAGRECQNHSIGSMRRMAPPWPPNRASIKTGRPSSLRGRKSLTWRRGGEKMLSKKGKLITEGGGSQRNGKKVVEQRYALDDETNCVRS